MKNHFIAIISILCALSLAFSAVPACADEVPATATDLQETEQEILQEETPGEPAAEPEQEGQPAGTADETATEPVAGNDNEPAETPGDEAQPEEKTAEETATEETAEAAAEEAQPAQEAPQEELVTEAEAPKVSAELIISKAVRMGGVWEGLTKDTNPATLKLDLDKAQKVHVIVEGRKVVWATVEKADRPESAPGKTLSDPETKRLIILIVAIHNLFSALVQPFSGPLSSGLRAAGDVKFTMWASIFATVVCRTLLSFLLAKWLGLGVIGITLAMVMDWCIKAALDIFRFRSGKWKENRII